MSQQGESESPKLPSEADFVVYGSLDEVAAWTRFGGLTLDQAKAKFAENPSGYSEDFMWMGTSAFAFYFPVLDDYLRSVPDEDEPESDSQAGIIGYLIKFQFETNEIAPLQPLIPTALALSEYVRTNLSRFGRAEQDRRRVAEAWNETERHVLAIAAS